MANKAKITAGIDIGSVATKCVLVKEARVIASNLGKTGFDVEKSTIDIFYDTLKKAKISKSKIGTVVSTGYGRRTFKEADRTITEVSAAGYGAYILTGRKNCLVIDVGGQDTKIININKTGRITDFLMNDKCAAGTGRFLELMVDVLETDLEGLSNLALKSRKPVTINSTCSVFAESEAVSLIAHSVKREDIAAGLFDAIATRINNMIKQAHSSNPIVFSGGGAKSSALKKSLERITKREITILDNPQFVAAYGAALLDSGSLPRTS
ncbi:MAG: hypothetical protein FJZ16_02880 [Candidatus Omnitrophica bacterium]|nr:hypothetical protein [Candidatus Omnitrophota bacterium]